MAETADPLDDDDALAFSVATVWREERVSCPHPQILRAYLTGGLPEGAQAFLKFHLEDSQCPYCLATLDDLRAEDEAAADVQMEDMRDRILRSTVTELRRSGPR